jgi:hypothetical protein
MNDLTKRTAPKCASCGQYSTHENLVAVRTNDGSGKTYKQSAGLLGVSVEGNPPADPLDEALYFAVSSRSEAVGIAGNQSASVIISRLEPGQHTFEMVYKTVGGTTITFADRFLQVTPL